MTDQVFRGCPGGDNVKIPELQIETCPQCGGEVEFFTRDKKVSCPECGNIVYREVKQSCIDWCPMAEQCFGAEAVKKYKAGGK